MATIEERLTRPPRPAVGPRSSWTRLLIGFAVLYGALGGTSAVDATGRWGLAILGAVLVTALAVEKALFGSAPTAALRRLGFGRPHGRALAVAAVVSGVVLLLYPLTTALTGAPVQLRPDWPWLALGVFAFHGLAEEMVWRGFAYRRLREGRSFLAAVGWSMPLVAAAHVPIVVTLGPTIGFGAMLVAAVTSLPFTYLYETGNRTIWAPALVHAAIDGFKLVVIPAAALSTFSPLILVGALLVPLLALAVPRRLLAAERTKEAGEPR